MQGPPPGSDPLPDQDLYRASTAPRGSSLPGGAGTQIQAVHCTPARSRQSPVCAAPSKSLPLSEPPLCFSKEVLAVTHTITLGLGGHGRRGEKAFPVLGENSGLSARGSNYRRS